MKALCYECGLYIYISKNVELHKNLTNMVTLGKKETTEVISFGFSKDSILKILLTRKKILFKMLSTLIDQYVVFTYTETMLRNALRKRSCRRFVRNQEWWDTVVNNDKS